MSANAPTTRYQRFVLLLSCLGMFIVMLDGTVVSVALPTMSDELGVSRAALPWVMNAYSLPLAGFLLLGGRCSDILGRRAVMLIGMALFTAASLVGGFAGNPAVLLTARVAQGLGGALLNPATLALLTAAFPMGPARTRALSTWSAVGAIGASAGPIVGGLLTQGIGWRSVFFVNVPLGIAVLVGCAIVVPRKEAGTTRPRLDVVGGILATVGLMAVVYGVMEGGVEDWAEPHVIGSLVAGAGVLALFVVHQGRWAADPLIPPRLFRIGGVRSSNVVMFLVSLGFFASPVLITFTLQYVYREGPLGAGLIFLPCGIAMFVGARIAGPLTVRLGAQRTTVLGCAVGALGFVMAAVFTHADSSYVVAIIVPSVIFGLGTTAAFTPLMVIATADAGSGLGGIAAALFNTVRRISGAIGLAVLTTAAEAASDTLPEGPVGLARGYAVAYALSAAFVAAGGIVAAFTLSRRRLERRRAESHVAAR